MTPGPAGSASRVPLSLHARILQCITSDGSAVISPRMARWLEQQSGMTSDVRIRLRDSDPEAYVALAALHLSALGADCGTNTSVRQHRTAESNTWASTSETAEALSVTDRTVRKWCAAGRLPAVQVGSRWLINRSALNRTPSHQRRTPHE